MFEIAMRCCLCIVLKICNLTATAIFVCEISGEGSIQAKCVCRQSICKEYSK